MPIKCPVQSPRLSHRQVFAIVGVFVLSVRMPSLRAQDLAPAPVQLTSEQDHQRLLDLLHIKELRRGPNGDPKSRNAANLVESKVPSYSLPDPLHFDNDQPVKTANDWWSKRRPELVELFDREIYGRVPAKTPAVHWEVVKTQNEDVEGISAITKELIGRVDNSAYPQIAVNIQLSVTNPAAARGPVPVIMEFAISREILARMKQRFTPEQWASF